MPMPKNTMLFGFEPKLTDEQRHYVDSIFDKQMVIVDAIAGSGKTTLATACAKLLNKELVYIFAPVEENKMGFRPGTQEEKEIAYTVPLLDALAEIGEDPNQVVFSESMMEDPRYAKLTQKRIKDGDIWVYPKSHIFARGTNIKDKVVIIDEAQNFTKSELRKVLTRIHDSCKVIMIGHNGQCDLENPALSGFQPYIEHYRSESYVEICKLTKNFRGRLAQHADKIA